MILTNGGGAGVLATDHLADEHGTFADLSEATRAALDRQLPPTWSNGNPVDVIGDATPERYAAALATLLADPGCDAVLAINCPTALASSTEIASHVLSMFRSAKSTKPLVTNGLGAQTASVALKILSDDISHKSDVGGVHLGLTSPGAVEARCAVSWASKSPPSRVRARSGM